MFCRETRPQIVGRDGKFDAAGWGRLYVNGQ